MDNALDKLMASLHPLERKVLPLIQEFSEFSMLLANSGLKEVQVMRAIQWLGNKEIVKIKDTSQEIIVLEENGIKYAEHGLPEKKFLQAIHTQPLHLQEIGIQASLSKEELNACIGILKKKVCIEITKGEENLPIISITEQGKKQLHQESLEEKFLKKSFPIKKANLSAEENYACNALIRRKDIIRDEISKEKQILLSAKGITLLEEYKDKLQEHLSERLTSKMLLDNSWKKHKFRPYDVSINVPKINYGKRHFVNKAVEYARKVWLELGFKEMDGPLLQTGFWNFDALFTAQDHPVREMQDTYYIKDPEYGKLPDKKILNRVKAAHENGGTTGSKGWQYKWNEEEAKRNVLRTHTTALSAQTIAKLKKEDLPAKFFAVGKCFRNEALDWSHLFEFNQFEGIVVDPDANFRHLIGYLKEFMKKIGFPKARFRPAYFPYTEPSLEIDVYHPIHKTWIEIGAAGIFRPEVVVPLLGKDIPVLAWGPGLDRQMMDYYQIRDIRELYKNDIKQLRQMKTWVK
ncbi:MAG: phenylalanine--tRNA ligase subunit alpha [Nanoarchaeota archaeon]|nr:phenylalanine--tRNA ligase subunit alpha [Nanoarchaeota archaeon]